MITIYKTTKYQKERDKFVKNNLPRAKALISALTNFINNPQHPSLHLEKLGGSDVWTIRIDKGNRIFFSYLDPKTVLFIDIGKHDKYRLF